MKNIKLIYILLFVSILMSCKVDDPFVDRVIAPVLVIFENPGTANSNGLTTEPSITSSASADAAITVRLLELNKDGLLNNKVGIDSVAATAVPVTFKFRTGTKIANVTTNDKGRSILTVSWKTLGIETPKAGSSVLLSCSATYKTVPFTKLFRLTATK